MTATHSKRYSAVAMIFHWVIAAAVIALWQLSEFAHDAEHGGNEELHHELMMHHKALGITVLVLTVLRIVWKMGHPAPALPKSMKGWEVFLTKAVHGIFYIMLIGLPLGGWAASSFAHYPIDMWGAFNVPMAPLAENKDIAGTIIELHGEGGEILLILIGLHILGALKHTFFDKAGGLARMLPFGKVER